MQCGKDTPHSDLLKPGHRYLCPQGIFQVWTGCVILSAGFGYSQGEGVTLVALGTVFGYRDFEYHLDP